MLQCIKHSSLYFIVNHRDLKCRFSRLLALTGQGKGLPTVPTVRLRHRNNDLHGSGYQCPVNLMVSGRAFFFNKKKKSERKFARSNLYNQTVGLRKNFAYTKRA